MGFTLDSGKEGFHMFFKDWELKVLEFLWSTQQRGATSGMAWSHLLETMDEPMSRASVINYLKEMAENGVLREDKEPGRGGYHGVYYPNYSESELKQYLAEYIIRKLLEEYPVETRKVLAEAH